MRALVRLAWIGLAIAGLQLLVSVVVFVLPNPEGWLGGLLYAAFYAVPLALIALALRSGIPWLQTSCGWLAMLLAICFTAIPIGNWAGYASLQAVFAVAITVPTVLFYLAVFWTVVTRRGVRDHQLSAAG
jgi:hypothetical protein